jgi:hypothetical protein
MITGPHFRAVRALFNWMIADLTEESRLKHSAILCAAQADGMLNMNANDFSGLQRVVETAAMGSIDGDAAIGAGVRRRQP